MKKLLVVLGCMMLATLIWAQGAPSTDGPSQDGPRERRMGPPPVERVNRLAKDLGLSQDQTAQLKQIFADQEKMRVAERETMDNLSPEERHAKMMETREQVDAKIEAILTDAQKQKFQQIRARMKQRRGPGGPGEDPPPPSS